MNVVFYCYELQNELNWRTFDILKASGSSPNEGPKYYPTGFGSMVKNGIKIAISFTVALCGNGPQCVCASFVPLVQKSLHPTIVDIL